MKQFINKKELLKACGGISGNYLLDNWIKTHNIKTEHCGHNIVLEVQDAFKFLDWYKDYKTKKEEEQETLLSAEEFIALHEPKKREEIKGEIQ